MSGRRRSSWVLWAPLAVALGVPWIARADTADAERKAAAQALFDEARKLTEGGDYAAACPKFAESRRLDATMGTTFYLADCLEHVGKLASAWSYYLEVADAARAVGQQERDAYARARADALKQRLPALVIEVPPSARAVPGLVVRRNGIVVGEAQWGAAIPVDLGEHIISAAADGKQPWEAKAAVTREGETIRVEVPAPKDVAPVPVGPLAPVPTPPTPPAPPARMSGQRIAGIVVGAAGLVGLGVGAVLGLQAMSKQRESDDGHCDAADFCDDTGIALREEAIAAATASTVSFVAGGIALAAGATLFLTAPASSAPSASAQGALHRAGEPRWQLAVGAYRIAVLARF